MNNRTKTLLIVFVIGSIFHLLAFAKRADPPRAEFVPGIDVTPRSGETVFTFPLPQPEARKCHYGGEIETCRDRCWPRGQQVVACTVKTIQGQMTEVCVCGDTSLYTKDSCADEIPPKAKS